MGLMKKEEVPDTLDDEKPKTKAPPPSEAGADVPLHVKYRPTKFKDVLGQDATVTSVAKVLKEGGARAFIFTGLSGGGKTTMGRIIAAKVGCTKQNLVEIDAATNSGVDAMKGLTESMQYSALGGSPTKVYIIDEAHMLSRAAWNSLLKSIEEPPPHVYWVICTTEAAKIPATISNRCAVYNLKPVSKNLLLDLLEKVREAEGFKTPDTILQLIASKAEGSPRRALTALAKCRDATDRQEAAELMDVMGDENEGEAVELCRALIRGAGWGEITEIIGKLKGQNPESVRCVVAAYFEKALTGSGNASDKKIMQQLDILDAFSRPYQTTQGLYPVLLSCGKVVFG